MKFLVYDTETTGLPQSKYVKMSLVDLWPYVVQFSYIIYDSETNKLEKNDQIIKIPENVIMSQENIALHGITNEMSSTCGVSINNVIEEFLNTIERVDLIIGHNLEFDLNMLKIEIMRMIRDTTNEEIKKIYQEKLIKIGNYDKYYCTMKTTVDLCKLPSPYKKNKDQYKYPKLDELHNYLFGLKPQKLHNSLNDVIITLRCFYKLKYDQDICHINSDMEKTIKYLM